MRYREYRVHRAPSGRGIQHCLEINLMRYARVTKFSCGSVIILTIAAPHKDSGLLRVEVYEPSTGRTYFNVVNADDPQGIIAERARVLFSLLEMQPGHSRIRLLADLPFRQLVVRGRAPEGRSVIRRKGILQGDFAVSSDFRLNFEDVDDGRDKNSFGLFVVARAGACLAGERVLLTARRLSLVDSRLQITLLHLTTMETSVVTVGEGPVVRLLENAKKIKKAAALNIAAHSIDVSTMIDALLRWVFRVADKRAKERMVAAWRRDVEEKERKQRVRAASEARIVKLMARAQKSSALLGTPFTRDDLGKDCKYEDAWRVRADELRMRVVDETRAAAMAAAEDATAVCLDSMRVILKNARAVRKHEERRALWHERGPSDGDEGHLLRCSFQLSVDVDTLADAGEEAVAIPANKHLPVEPAIHEKRHPGEEVMLLIPSKSHLPIEPVEYILGRRCSRKEALYHFLGASDESSTHIQRCILSIRQQAICDAQRES